MKIIVCIEDNGGMMFNGRRLSRDRLLIRDIERSVGQGMLRMSEYSAPLFADTSCLTTVSASFLEEAEPVDYCFVENRSLASYLPQIDEIWIYHWNRRYPADHFLDINPQACGFQLSSVTEFVGHSHQTITKEIFKR